MARHSKNWEEIVEKPGFTVEETNGCHRNPGVDTFRDNGDYEPYAQPPVQPRKKK